MERNKLAKPLHDRVLIEPIQKAEKTHGGIIIPDTVTQNDQTGQLGKVIAIGPGLYTSDGSLIPMTVQVGDDVIFGKFTGTEITLEDKKYLIMREGDIFMTIR